MIGVWDLMTTLAIEPEPVDPTFGLTFLPTKKQI